MNLLTDPNFELGTGWAYFGGASRTTVPPPFSGTYSARLYSRYGSTPPIVTSLLWQDLTVVPGVSVPLAFRFNLDGLPPLPFIDGFSTLSVEWDSGAGVGYEIVASFAKQDFPSGWNRIVIDLPVPAGPSVSLRFSLGFLEVDPPPGVWMIEGFCQIDAVEFGDEEAHIMRSSALPFMDRLKGLIEAIDPNIGNVYVTTKRWPTIERLEQDGTLRINAAGILDDVTRVGQDVTRFWWMRPRINCQPLTNGSAEYVTEIEITGFYQHEDGDAQVSALSQAAIEILDALNTKTAELTTLNTGDAYLGYLLNRPTMDPIQSAQLESPKVVGNSVRITVSFAEEVSYA